MLEECDELYGQRLIQRYYQEMGRFDDGRARLSVYYIHSERHFDIFIGPVRSELLIYQIEQVGRHDEL